MSGQLGHIGGALNVPIGSLTEKMSQLENSKDREIVTVCRSGARAMTAAQILTTAGFRRVTLLAGGMIAWNKSTHEPGGSNLDARTKRPDDGSSHDTRTIIRQDKRGSCQVMRQRS